jgi:heat shock protein HtpX
MVKKMMLFSFFLLFGVFVYGEAETKQKTFEVVQELKKMKNEKQSDFALRYEGMRDAGLKAFFDEFDLKKKIAEEPSFFKRLQLSLFLQGGGIGKCFRGGLVLITPERLPKLYSVINELTNEAGMRMPVAFLAGNSKMFNAFASSTLAKSCSLIGLGEDLIKELSDDEIKCLIAHELGHIKKKHRLKKVFLPTLIILASLCVVGKCAFNLAKDGDGESSGEDERNAATLISVIVLNIIGHPFLNPLYSRHCEKEADIFAARLTKDPDSMISLFRLFDEVDSRDMDIKKLRDFLARELKKDPELRKRIGKIKWFWFRWRLRRAIQFRHIFYKKFRRSWFATHPSIEERIENIELAS